MAAPTIAGFSTTTVAVTDGLVTGPTQAAAGAAGDLCLICISGPSAATLYAVSNVAGWQLITVTGASTGTYPTRSYLFKRILRSSDPAPVWQLQVAGSGIRPAILQWITGAAGSPFIGVDVFGTNNSYQLAGAAHSNPAVTTVVADTLISHFRGIQINPTIVTITPTYGAGQTARELSSGQTLAAALSTEVASSSGAQTARTFATQAALNADYAGVTVALSFGTSFRGESALALASAPVGTVSLGLGPMEIAGVTAACTVICDPGTPTIGTVVPGDNFASAIAISGASGSTTANVSGATVESGEPAGDGGAPTKSIWFQYTATSAGSLTIRGTTTSSSYVIEGWDGASLPELSLITSGDYHSGVSTTLPEIFWRASSGHTYIRVTNNAAFSTGSSVGIDYFFSASVDSLELDILTPSIARGPSVVKVGFLNATPGEDVEFDVSGMGVLLTLVADDSGVGSGTIPIPETTAGTKTVTATGLTSGKTATGTFIVEFDSPPAPTPPTADTPPSAVVQTGVVKWVLQDPAPGGEQYILDINPKRMMSPYAPKIVTPENTTASDGTVILWEGARRAHAWGFEGTITDQAQYDAFVRFLNLQRKFYLTDHKERTWVVTFESFNPEHVGWNGNLATYKYSIEAYIFAGPLEAI